MNFETVDFKTSSFTLAFAGIHEFVKRFRNRIKPNQIREGGFGNWLVKFFGRNLENDLLIDVCAHFFRDLAKFCEQKEKEEQSKP